MARTAKPLVIGAFSILWLVVSIVRIPDGIIRKTDIGVDTSWVLALAETLHQHLISGRDFHFTYGPLSQTLAYAGASLHLPWSGIDSLPLIILAFYAASIILLGWILLLLRFLGWKECLFIYLALAVLNLFSDPTAFRPLALMLCAVFLFRAQESPAARSGLAWSAAAGAAGFAAQSLTFELGPYCILMAIAVEFTWMALRTRKHAAAAEFYDSQSRARSLARIGVLLAVYIAANVALEFLFVLSSSTYRFFDYQRYALEMIRGFSFSQTLPWELTAGRTAGLAFVCLYAVCAGLFIYLRLDARAGRLFIPLLACSLVELKSVTVRSDLGHITQSSSPFVFVFLLAGALLISRARSSWRFLASWAVAFAVLFVSWPWAGLYSASDFKMALTGTSSPIRKLVRLCKAVVNPEDILPEGSSAAPDRESSRPLLSFPYENYIPIALKRRMVAPVLMSYNASTKPLQEFYVRSLERERDLDVVYGMDSVSSKMIDGVQSITRTPEIFDYLYRHFRLSDRNCFGKGYYLLRRRADLQLRDFRSIKVTVDVGQSDNHILEVRPQKPTPCGLLRLDLEIDYPLSQYLGHPAPLEVLFFSDGIPFLKTGLVAIRSNAPFSTLISLIPEEYFFKVFDEESFPLRQWDRIQILPRSPDLLGALPKKISIRGIECLQ